MQRRGFIGATVGVGLAGVAGCLASASPRPPAVPDDRLEDGGWELEEELQEDVFTETYAGQEVTATATTRVYADAALEAELDEKTLGQLTDAPAMFFASRVTFDPDLTNLPGGVGRGEIVDQVEAESRGTFEDRMREAGIQAVERVDTGELTVESGDTARRTDYLGELPFGPMELPVTADRSVEIAGADIDVAGRLAVWHYGDSVLVAGGAFPAENYAETIDEELSSAIDITVDIDLDLDPDAYEEELLGLMTRVE